MGEKNRVRIVMSSAVKESNGGEESERKAENPGTI